jgi:hypothetical protein
MKQAKGKKITFRDIEQAIIDEFAPQPFDRYDHQEVVDRLKEKRIKVESISKLKESLVEKTITAVWKKGALHYKLNGQDMVASGPRWKSATGRPEAPSEQEVKKLIQKRVKGDFKLIYKINEAVVLTDPEKLTAQWKKKAKENPDIAHWMHIAKTYKKAAMKCQDKLKEKTK